MSARYYEEVKAQLRGKGWVRPSEAGIPSGSRLETLQQLVLTGAVERRSVNSTGSGHSRYEYRLKEAEVA